MSTANAGNALYDSATQDPTLWTAPLADGGSYFKLSNETRAAADSVTVFTHTAL